jgi:hypothetical protein
MFFVLRVVLLVALIFWLSPLRPGQQPEQPQGAPEADFERVRRLVEAVERLSPRDREKAAETLREAGANMAGIARMPPLDRPTPLAADKR